MRQVVLGTWECKGRGEAGGGIREGRGMQTLHAVARGDPCLWKAPKPLGTWGPSWRDLLRGAAPSLPHPTGCSHRLGFLAVFKMPHMSVDQFPPVMAPGLGPPIYNAPDSWASKGFVSRATEKDFAQGQRKSFNFSLRTSECFVTFSSRIILEPQALYFSPKPPKKS